MFNPNRSEHLGSRIVSCVYVRKPSTSMSSYSCPNDSTRQVITTVYWGLDISSLAKSQYLPREKKPHLPLTIVLLRL